MIALKDKVEIVTQALPYPKEELFYIRMERRNGQHATTNNTHRTKFTPKKKAAVSRGSSWKPAEV
ncbi:hypothetical protein STFR1_10615 [Bacillus vallismortis]